MDTMRFYKLSYIDKNGAEYMTGYFRHFARAMRHFDSEVEKWTGNGDFRAWNRTSRRMIGFPWEIVEIRHSGSDAPAIRIELSSYIMNTEK